MKKLICLFVIASFSVAVCYAVPHIVKSETQKVDVGKKHIELQPFLITEVFEVPPAPLVFYDIALEPKTQTFKVVFPQSNSPPEKLIPIEAYSMAHWRK